jgi:electron transfer flavoprotein beta subunit
LSLDDFKDKEPLHYGLNGSPTQVERIFPPEVNNKKRMVEGIPETLSKELLSILDDYRLV